MQDRIPLYPGRVTLTPVSGQTNTYDMARADEPTQEGTPLNKENLLKDATAAALGLTGDATVDAAFAESASKFTTLTAAIAAGAKIATGSYVGTGTYGSSNPCSLTFDFEPLVVMLFGSTTSVSIAPGTYSGVKSWPLILDRSIKTFYSTDSNTDYNSVTFSGSSISWYAGYEYANAEKQLNVSGWTYRYIAFG